MAGSSAREHGKKRRECSESNSPLHGCSSGPGASSRRGRGVKRKGWSPRPAGVNDSEPTDPKQAEATCPSATLPPSVVGHEDSAQEAANEELKHIPVDAADRIGVAWRRAAARYSGMRLFS